MIEAYLAHNETKTATFGLFLLKLAAQRGFLMPAGLEQALKFLEGNALHRRRDRLAQGARRASYKGPAGATAPISVSGMVSM